MAHTNPKAPADLTPAAARVLAFFDTLPDEDAQCEFLGHLGRYARAADPEASAAALADFRAWIESRRAL